MAQTEIEAPKPELAVIIVDAAKRAFQRVNISVPWDHPIFSDLSEFARGKKGSNATTAHDFQSPSKAKQFVSALVSEFKKAGVYDEYAQMMDIRAKGADVVLTQKTPARNASSKIRQAPELQTLRSAFAAAANKVGTTLLESATAEFVNNYAKHLAAKEKNEIHGGATLLLKIGSEDKAQVFAKAFEDALKRSRTKFDVSVEVRKDFPPDRYAVVLEIPRLGKAGFL